MKRLLWLLPLLLFSVAHAEEQPYTEVNGGVPYFETTHFSGDVQILSCEGYSELDLLGRCGAAYACLGADLMPTAARGDISGIRPTGWHSVQYDEISGKYLYNRCHLIGRQLSGEDANEKNLITGTRYLNISGMLPFENMTADYIKETDNHVMYRSTPYFSGNELVARGVYLEAWSAEDNGEGICFNVYCPNTQPGIVIDYATGDSHADGEYVGLEEDEIFHLSGCETIASADEEKLCVYDRTRAELIADGYIPCAICNP